MNVKKAEEKETQIVFALQSPPRLEGEVRLEDVDRKWGNSALSEC